MWGHQILIAFTTIIIGLGGAVNNSLGTNDDKWPGIWFPARPGEESKAVIQPIEKIIQPKVNDIEDDLQTSETQLSADKWKGKWFPAQPGQTDPNETIPNKQAILPKEQVSENMTSPIIGHCDDGMTNLVLDYDPANITHHSRHLCLNEKNLYVPNYGRNPRLLDYIIPPEYIALHKCVDVAIKYDYDIPTFGTHRKLWPVYGEYVYVPPQRWIHNLEHGAIVLLYHPCANLNQLDIAKSIIKKCLFRHIITAYDRLEPELPFALVAWGHSLEFSVVDQAVIVGFIRLYALNGPENISRDGQYNQTLIEQANIITSEDDDVLCENL